MIHTNTTFVLIFCSEEFFSLTKELRHKDLVSLKCSNSRGSQEQSREGHLGERFTTKHWDGFTASKTVTKCIDNTWKFKERSKFSIRQLDWLI